MLYWSAVFFIVAIIAGVFGFLGIASAAAGIAKVLFFIFAVLFVVSLITGMRGAARPRYDGHAALLAGGPAILTGPARS
jgi:uncharacterized membrane protein YtjA (UPF0391 family)